LVWDLKHELTAAYEKSKLWRQLRNYPQPRYDDASAGSAKHGTSDTNDVTERVAAEQSTRRAMDDTEGFRANAEGEKPQVASSDREQGPVTNEPRSPATDVHATPYTAAVLVEAM
jgi:hypothetical protein